MLLKGCLASSIVRKKIEVSAVLEVIELMVLLAVSGEGGKYLH